LSSFVQVDESEWKAFLEDLSQFEKKYQHLLQMLDLAESKLQALTAPEKKELVSAEASRQAAVKSPEKKVGGEVKGGFLNRLKTKLEPLGRSSMGRNTGLGILSRPQGYAVCSRCGSQIVRATRFCQRCGADFGKMVCSCGHELSVGDKFCDRCGRGVSG
jgi:hypothetical protein